MRQEYDSIYHYREGVGVLFALLPKHNVCLLRANDAGRDASVPYREIAEPQRGATIQFHCTSTPVGSAPPAHRCTGGSCCKLVQTALQPAPESIIYIIAARKASELHALWRNVHHPLEN